METSIDRTLTHAHRYALCFMGVHHNTVDMINVIHSVSGCHAGAGLIQCEDIYQDELWVIPANFDKGRAGVPPHILYSSGPRGLEEEMLSSLFCCSKTVMKEEVLMCGSVKATHLVFLTNLKRDCFKQLQQQKSQKKLKIWLAEKFSDEKNTGETHR